MNKQTNKLKKIMLWILQKDFQILIYAVASAHRQSKLV